LLAPAEALEAVFARRHRASSTAPYFEPRVLPLFLHPDRGATEKVAHRGFELFIFYDEVSESVELDALIDGREAREEVVEPLKVCTSGSCGALGAIDANDCTVDAGDEARVDQRLDQIRGDVLKLKEDGFAAAATQLRDRTFDLFDFAAVREDQISGLCSRLFVRDRAHCSDAGLCGPKNREDAPARWLNR
jgi:hypothetical protein